MDTRETPSGSQPPHLWTPLRSSRLTALPQAFNRPSYFAVCVSSSDRQQQTICSTTRTHPARRHLYAPEGVRMRVRFKPTKKASPRAPATRGRSHDLAPHISPSGILQHEDKDAGSTGRRNPTQGNPTSPRPLRCYTWHRGNTRADIIVDDASLMITRNCPIRRFLTTHVSLGRHQSTRRLSKTRSHHQVWVTCLGQLKDQGRIARHVQSYPCLFVLIYRRAPGLPGGKATYLSTTTEKRPYQY